MNSQLAAELQQMDVSILKIAQPAHSAGSRSKDKWLYKTKHGQAAELIAFKTRSVTRNVARSERNNSSSV